VAQEAFGKVAWSQRGAEPRWLGMESSDCVAAFNPSYFHKRGDTEFKRFLRGAEARQEVALIVANVGEADDDSPRSVLSQHDASVRLPEFHGAIMGRRLPVGARISPAPELPPAERDLGLRLLNRSDTAPWWALSTQSTTMESSFGTSVHTPEGELQPILVDGLGEPVVAVWVPEDGRERWYIVPDATTWDTIVDWLVRQALPAYVPDALRRVRSPHFVDIGLETVAESTARQALEVLEASYAEQKARLEGELRDAREAAGSLREGLLYGTDRELEDAVATVLTAAGFTVEQLDDQLGTTSADLLATLGKEMRLIEVKSAGGAASEKLVNALHKHLETWPRLRPGQPVGGGALVVNHQHKLDPRERSQTVYGRRAFVESLTVPVISSRMLFDWWRASDWAAVQAAVLGQPAPASLGPGPSSGPGQQVDQPDAARATPRRRSWATQLLGRSPER
jgi:hypothetical protein